MARGTFQLPGLVQASLCGRGARCRTKIESMRSSSDFIRFSALVFKHDKTHSRAYMPVRCADLAPLRLVNTQVGQRPINKSLNSWRFLWTGGPGFRATEQRGPEEIRKESLVQEAKGGLGS